MEDIEKKFDELQNRVADLEKRVFELENDWHDETKESGNQVVDCGTF